jgi:NhaC family Na+:H+ antiporter
LLVALSVRKAPASLALISAAIFAGILGVFTQPKVVGEFVAHPGLDPVRTGLMAVWRAMATGFEMHSGIPEVDQLLSRGGMASMLYTLWLIIGAVTFGTLIEEFGLITRLIDPMVRAARGTGRLYLTVFASAFGLNIVAGDQYIALVLPSRIFRAEFARRGLAPTNLSRLAADSGTVTSPLVPWNSCGAFMGAVLGVSCCTCRTPSSVLPARC